jgi:hypothetical protein
MTPGQNKPTIDFSFSLTCRGLEGKIKQPLNISVAKYEQAYAEVKKDGNWNELSNNPFTKGLIYDTDVRIAYDHGKVDGDAFAFFADTFVTEVTPEIIAIEGGQTSIGPLEYGTIDRHTGHVDYSAYHLNVSSDSKPNDWNGVSKYLWQQFAFECEPSPPAKF